MSSPSFFPAARTFAIPIADLLARLSTPRNRSNLLASLDAPSEESTKLGLGVNAAFFAEIKNENEQLRSLVLQLLRYCSARPPLVDDLGAWATLLSEFREQLAFHFALEESVGYFDDAVVESPHLSRRAELLRDEHARLYASACELAKTADSLLLHPSREGNLGILRRDARKLLQALQDHERVENDLIQASANVDLGTCD